MKSKLKQDKWKQSGENESFVHLYFFLSDKNGLEENLANTFSRPHVMRFLATGDDGRMCLRYNPRKIATEDHRKRMGFVHIDFTRGRF